MQFDHLRLLNNCCDDKNKFSIFSIPPKQFTLLATLIGFLTAKDLDVDEQNSLGNFFIAIGQVLVTIASQKTIFESKQDNQEIKQRLDDLKRHINDIEKELERNTKN
ncbi:hypothetical protein [Desulfolucanica intricata]|uniref:hypothetical protein n=1 Tax=Desulfolucanica intricata TaxID=1285191 RepID=UPI0008370FA6|nr:hypothetical protein [Desulfolucanica intricata]